MTTPKLSKVRKVWAVCFALNRKCMQGNIHTFNSRAEANTYIKELHKKIGGFEEDHHIVPCTITYKFPLPTKRSK